MTAVFEIAIAGRTRSCTCGDKLICVSADASIASAEDHQVWHERMGDNASVLYERQGGTE